MAIILALMPAVVLILFAIVMNEILTSTSRYRVGRRIHCRVCGRSMEQVHTHWSYQFPFEIWVVTSRYNLAPSTVKRYLCPEKHTQAWYIPNLGDRKCDVLVTKDFWVS
jgi:hypothetical protein